MENRVTVRHQGEVEELPAGALQQAAVEGDRHGRRRRVEFIREDLDPAAGVVAEGAVRKGDVLELLRGVVRLQVHSRHRVVAPGVAEGATLEEEVRPVDDRDLVAVG